MITQSYETRTTWSITAFGDIDDTQYWSLRLATCHLPLMLMHCKAL